MRNFTFKAVIFDLDGTLLNTLDDIADSMNTVLQSLGYPTHHSEEYKYFIGDGIYALAEKVLPTEHLSPPLISSCVKMMLKEYSTRWANKTKLYDGVSHVLDALKKNGFKLAIFSNKPDQFTQEAVRHFLDKWHFDIILGATETIAKKPQPDGALAIAKQMNIAPENILYIGDTSTDMQTATAANMYAAGVLWGFRNKEELEKAGASVLLHRPEEILALL